MSVWSNIRQMREWADEHPAGPSKERVMASLDEASAAYEVLFREAEQRDRERRLVCVHDWVYSDHFKTTCRKCGVCA